MAVRPPEGNLEEDAARDSDAGRESKDFDRLDQIEGAKHAVRLAVHRTLAVLVPVTVFGAFLIFWVGIVIFSIHLLTPWHWLTDEQLREVRTVLFSSVLGAIVSQGIKRYLD